MLLPRLGESRNGVKLRVAGVRRGRDGGRRGLHLQRSRGPGGAGTRAGTEFIDAGCGSWLSCSRRVTAFDADPLSVEAARIPLGRHAAGSPWTVPRGSLTDDAFPDGISGSGSSASARASPGRFSCSSRRRSGCRASLFESTSCATPSATAAGCPRGTTRSTGSAGTRTFASADEVTAFRHARGFDALVVRPDLGERVQRFPEALKDGAASMDTLFTVFTATYFLVSAAVAKAASAIA